jgi:hypothetical protein
VRNRSRKRALLIGAGLVLGVATLLAALLPWQRLESVSRERVPVTAPSTSPLRGDHDRLVLNKEVRTERPLSEPTLIALLAAAVFLIVAGLFFSDFGVDELQVGGMRMKRREVGEALATATLARAREEGRLAGETVSVDTAKDLAATSAAAGMRVEALLERRAGRQRDRTESLGFVPRMLLEDLARRAVEEEREAEDGGTAPGA